MRGPLLGLVVLGQNLELAWEQEEEEEEEEEHQLRGQDWRALRPYLPSGL